MYYFITYLQDIIQFIRNTFDKIHLKRLKSVGTHQQQLLENIPLQPKNSYSLEQSTYHRVKPIQNKVWIIRLC